MFHSFIKRYFYLMKVFSSSFMNVNYLGRSLGSMPALEWVVSLSLKTQQTRVHEQAGHRHSRTWCLCHHWAISKLSPSLYRAAWQSMPWFQGTNIPTIICIVKYLFIWLCPFFPLWPKKCLESSNSTMSLLAKPHGILGKVEVSLLLSATNHAISLHSILYASDSQQEIIRSPSPLQAHLTICGNMFGCHTEERGATGLYWVEDRDSAKYAIMCRVASTQKVIPPKVSTGLRNPNSIQLKISQKLV